MNKMEFTCALCEKLSFLPWEEIEERVAFYSEMIDDRTEDGLSEEEAVEAVGTPDSIAEQIIAETPLTKLVKKKIKPKRKLGPLAIILIVLGSPIWLSIGLSLLAVVLSLYISLWAVVVILWASFASVVASGFAGIVAGVVLICSESVFAGLILIGAGLVCVGISILLFFLCKLTTKGAAILSKMPVVALKRKIVKRGDSNE